MKLPVDSAQSPRELVEAAVDEMGVRLTAPRATHQREGHERFTLDAILAEEQAVMDLVDARDDRSQLWVKDEDTAALSPRIRSEWSRTSATHLVWCNRCPRRLGRGRRPRCAPSSPPRTAAMARQSSCSRRRARPSTSLCAKVPATKA